MSRIIRGHSENVHSVRVEESRAVSGPAGMPQFRRKMMEGYLTSDEAKQMVNDAVGRARQEVAQEVEKRLKKPLQEGLQKLEEALEETVRFRQELLKESELDLLDLLGRVCKRVLGAELSVQPDLLKKIAENAIASLAKEKRILVSFSPQDQKMFEGFNPKAFESLAERPDIELRPESQIPANSVWLRTDRVEIEVELEKMVDQLLEQVVGQVRSAKETGDEEDKI